MRKLFDRIAGLVLAAAVAVALAAAPAAFANPPFVLPALAGLPFDYGVTRPGVWTFGGGVVQAAGFQANSATGRSATSRAPAAA